MFVSGNHQAEALNTHIHAGNLSADIHMSTCSVCGDVERNISNGDLPRWWIRAWKYGSRDQARILCPQCAIVIPHKSKA
jgi:hypothetical protein